MPTALITGASRGLGAEIARQLAPTHDLLLGGRPSPELDRLATELDGASTFAVDLTGYDEVEAAVEAIGRGIPVAVTSRSPQGRVEPIYGAGGGSDLAAAGAIFCGDLSGIKARILLALLLGAGKDPHEIRRQMRLRGD